MRRWLLRRIGRLRRVRRRRGTRGIDRRRVYRRRGVRVTVAGIGCGGRLRRVLVRGSPELGLARGVSLPRVGALGVAHLLHLHAGRGLSRRVHHHHAGHRRVPSVLEAAALADVAAHQAARGEEEDEAEGETGDGAVVRDAAVVVGGGAAVVLAAGGAPPLFVPVRQRAALALVERGLSLGGAHGQAPHVAFKVFKTFHPFEGPACVIVVVVVDAIVVVVFRVVELDLHLVIVARPSRALGDEADVVVPLGGDIDVSLALAVRGGARIFARGARARPRGCVIQGALRRVHLRGIRDVLEMVELLDPEGDGTGSPRATGRGDGGVFELVHIVAQPGRAAPLLLARVDGPYR